MHIAFVFSGEKVTDKEQRLVHLVRASRGVSRVTVTGVRPDGGFAKTFERIRAKAERTVGRVGAVVHDWKQFPDAIDTVEVLGTLDEVLRSLTADRIVNLSGHTAQAPEYASTIFELRWNGEQPDGLGELRATGAPPGEIVVVCQTGNAAPRVVQRSVLTPTPATPAADRRNAASRSVALMLRALALPDDELLNTRQVSAKVVSRRGSIARIASAAFASIAVGVAAVTRRVVRPLWRDDAWELQYRITPQQFVASTPAVSASGFKTYRGDYGRFFADSIALSHNDVTAVFLEEYPYALRRGVISCAVLQDNGELGPPSRVLERPFHLSYPFVFRDGAHVYMVPESSANRTVDLYECTTFPHQWTFRQTLLQNISATDATLHFDGSRWWMFATVGEQGAYGWDELHLFSADTLLSPWTPHPNNPVKCDPASARPAGPLFTKNGRLLRPTQDCSGSYGGAVNLCEIEELSLTDFRERIVDRLDPAMFPGANGLHTLSAAGDVEVVDVRPARRWRWEKGTVGTRTAPIE